jgi:hypothetical protein
MTTIIDTGALVRPAFEAAPFKPTKFYTAEDKAAFANTLCRFMASGFDQKLFTEKLYRRLAMSFGHIAHYNRFGFIAEFFENRRGQVAFLEQMVGWVPCGDPAYTFFDVERAVQGRLRACKLLDAYRALRTAEIEGAERELLRRLQTKYQDGRRPLTAAPVLHCPAPVRTRPASPAPKDQSSLF